MGKAAEAAESVRGIAQPVVTGKEQLGHLQDNGTCVLRQASQVRQGS